MYVSQRGERALGQTIVGLLLQQQRSAQQILILLRRNRFHLKGHNLFFSSGINANDIKEENNLLLKKKKTAKNLEKILDDYLDEVDAPKWQEGITWKNKPLKEFNSYH